MNESLPSKLLSEVILVSFNFTSELEWGDAVSSAVASVVVFSGNDESPADMLNGSLTISGNIVTQSIQLGHPGVIYLIQCAATTTDANVITLSRYLAVLSDDNSFLPSNVVRLIGTLPDAIANVPYSEPLDIIGGYSPYEAAGVASGTAPFWMNFHVEGNQLICEGTPNEDFTTEYVFSPQIRDAAANLADDPQDILSTHVAIYGDVPDGQVGDPVSGSYDQTDGQTPVSYVVYSGTFPAGVTLNSDGTYSGTFTTGAHYSWVVQGTDAVGNTAYVNDSCEVGVGQWALINPAGTSTFTATHIYTGPDAINWPNLYSKGSITSSGYGCITADNRLILSQNTRTDVQIVNPLSTAGVIDNYFVSTASINYIFTYADGILIKCRHAVNYDVSIDNGDTWTDYAGPSGLWMRAVCKHQGLWVAIFQFGSTQRIYTSNQTIPTTWTSRFTGMTGSVEHAIASDGVTVLAVNNIKDTYTSSNGVSWNTHSNNFPTNLGSAECIIISVAVGIFIVSTANTANHSIFRTTDSGNTWTTISLLAGSSNTTSMQFRYGKLVICFSDGNVFISEDLGITFTQYNPAEGSAGLLILPFFPVVGT